ncbi:hypothetical protein [Comamonas thiooxydans]|uniref:hypothetical protein n=1 Tax=Comamonas thiooxydans TaxID=363952 RepID=UPI00103DD3A7|nr:hypothetical protein [Comamonas thiooxydans]
MTTVTLIQAARYSSDRIHQMVANPGQISLSNLSGGAIQFGCSNPLATIKSCTSVAIVYDATASGSRQETIQISSVIS